MMMMMLRDVLLVLDDTLLREKIGQTRTQERIEKVGKERSGKGVIRVLFFV